MTDNDSTWLVTACQPFVAEEWGDCAGGVRWRASKNSPALARSGESVVFLQQDVMAMAPVLTRLTTGQSVGTLANIKAALLYRQRLDFDDGAILEIVVWRLSKPVEGCAHPFKYRLYYGLSGQRLVGYDNERPKGDHRHRDNLEEAYAFENPEKLIDDFFRDVDDRRARR